MALLPEPFEYLDLAHGDAVQVRIKSFLFGEANIAPRNPTARHRAIHMEQQGLTEPPAMHHPVTINIPVTRIYMERLDEPSPVEYYDISSKTLQAQLRPLLSSGSYRGRTITFTANGHAPSKRYSLAVT